MFFVKELFSNYLKDIQKIREESIDLSNVEFHYKNELRIKLPVIWNTEESLIETIKKISGNIFVFYSDTSCYRSFYGMCDNILGNSKVTNFVSFYELHSAITNSTQDIRPQQRIARMVGESSIVIVLDIDTCERIASNVVLNAIRQFTNGSLILIGWGKMSEYAIIELELADKNIIKESLKELEYPFEEYDVAQSLVGWLGDNRKQVANIIIRKRHIGVASNDIGFHKKANGKYELIISDYDKSISQGQTFLSKFKQTYAEKQVQKELKKKGYKLKKKKIETDGTIELRFS